MVLVNNTRRWPCLVLLSQDYVVSNRDSLVQEVRVILFSARSVLNRVRVVNYIHDDSQYFCRLQYWGAVSGEEMGLSKKQLPYIAATIVLFVVGILFFAFP